jgi:hypothetical protein
MRAIDWRNYFVVHPAQNRLTIPLSASPETKMNRRSGRSFQSGPASEVN